jgi:hypothetical protein
VSILKYLKLQITLKLILVYLILIYFIICLRFYCNPFFINRWIGDWGLGIGDWGLGIGPIPNPQSPIPNPQYSDIGAKIRNIKNELVLYNPLCKPIEIEEESKSNNRKI